MKPSDHQWQALVNLSNSPDWKHLRELMSSCLLEAQQTLEKGSNLEDLFRAQGRATQIRELLDTFDKSRDSLDRINESRHRQ